MEDISNDTIQNAPETSSKKRSWGAFSFLKSKYIIVLVLFSVWMMWFDPKDIPSGFARYHKYNELQESKKHLTGMIKETENELTQLKTDARTIEKYAREKYFMKKDNEDLFLVAPADSSQIK